MLALFALGAFVVGCGDGVDRWPGEGCQPACVVNAGSKERTAACVDPGGSNFACLEMDQGNVSCEEGELIGCDEENRPRCTSEAFEKPICVR
jgi:hypothetical protein